MDLLDFDKKELDTIYKSSECFKIRFYRRHFQTNKKQLQIESEALGLDGAVSRAAILAKNFFRRELSIEEKNDLRRSLSYTTIGWEISLERIK